VSGRALRFKCFKGVIVQVFRTASWQVAIVSSNANNGTNAGGFYWNLNNDSSNLNRNIGTHLADAEMWHKTPALMGEYGNPILLGSVSEQQGGHQQ
jgi:hypothetical protein